MLFFKLSADNFILSEIFEGSMYLYASYIALQ